jgi:hypothetical protein
MPDHRTMLAPIDEAEPEKKHSRWQKHKYKLMVQVRAHMGVPG